MSKNTSLSKTPQQQTPLKHRPAGGKRAPSSKMDPDRHSDGVLEGRSEEEPLLGRPGDASQPNSASMLGNLLIGTAVLAQAGIWIFVGVVWGSVLSSRPIILFHAHPLLNSAGILFLTQAVLILQPTHTASQKVKGTYWHSGLNGFGMALLTGGLVIIEYNKGLNPAAHWHSVHAYLGVITYCTLALQSLVGSTAFFTPKLYGSIGKAKSFYKWHRLSGYLVLILLFVTAGSATYTDFNISKLQIRLWAVVVSAIITIVGIVPRIRKSKFGL